MLCAYFWKSELPNQIKAVTQCFNKLALLPEETIPALCFQHFRGKKATSGNWYGWEITDCCLGHFLARTVSQPGTPHGHIDTCSSRKRSHHREADRTAPSSSIADLNSSPNLIFSSSGLKDIFPGTAFLHGWVSTSTVPFKKLWRKRRWG